MTNNFSCFLPKFTYSVGLTLTLQHIEGFLFAILCAAVITIFWMVGLLYFSVLWLFILLWRNIAWIIKVVVILIFMGIWIIWIILVWIGDHFYSLLLITARLTQPVWLKVHSGLYIFGIWAIHEFGETFVCTFCVFLGVLTTSSLPSALLLSLSSAALIGMTLSPLVALAIAARVFDTRAYCRWRSNRARLGVRVLRAYSDGLTWMLWMRKARVHNNKRAEVRG